MVMVVAPCVCVRMRGWGGRPCGLSADGGVVVAFVSLLLPLGLQIDVLLLGPVLWRAKGSPLKRSDTYYCLLNGM